MFIVNIISYILVLLGAVNWGLVGVFNFDLVSTVFMGARSIGAIVTYIVIALAAIWLIISAIVEHGKIRLNNQE